ncbi:MAG TPA: hypothetical protein PKD24_10670 [Pyrinomonadaceae bacterium]|nr:hypothetical protein [Pyrinomonadaceae bacterium]HMP65389.1 hypothetical protein [Pyrinomonadaceae bacterium]
MSRISAVSGAICLAFWIVFASAGCISAQDKTANSKYTAVQERHRQAEAELKRLTDLRDSLNEIPFNAEQREPYASLIKEHEEEIVYNEPAGQWIVRSDRFWVLAEKYKDLPIADDIAWVAANNPLPGECEGFVNCYLHWMRITHGRYLEAFPEGKYREDALKEIGDLVSDLNRDKDKSPDMWPTEEEELAEFRATLDVLVKIMSGTDSPQKEAVLADIEKLRGSVK